MGDGGEWKYRSGRLNMRTWEERRVEQRRYGVDWGGSGYHQKDRKPSQNDKTEHGMEKTVQNQGHKVPIIVKVKVNPEESAVKPEPELKNTIECNLNPSDGPGKPNSIIMKTVNTQMGPQSISTAHLCAIDKDCEDFEGPILAQLQPISAIVHTKPT
ncbi:hypothetical protein Tco_1015115 [Tanacetum coccineum]|uniref:Uncharacterized protein n=1 Tax=Tanacetum coccineum TaxID=301880 RepID=A0ABQ5FJV4_9ASTR